MEAAICQCLGSVEIIENHAQRDAILSDPLHVGHVRRIERERPREVRKPAPRERFGLEQRGDRDARCAICLLPASQLETFVRLDVRSERNAETLRSICHVFQVAIHRVAMEQQSGRFDVEHG